MTDSLSTALSRLTSAAREGDIAAFASAMQELARLLAAQRQNPTTIGPQLAFSVLKPAGLQVGQALVADPRSAPHGAEAPDGAALQCLTMLAGHGSAEIRCIACYAFGALASAWPTTRLPTLIPVAYALAKDESWEVREFIANAFDEVVGAAHPEAVYALMQQWVRDADANVRRVPTNALMRYGRSHPEAVIDLMHELVHDRSTYVRDNVVFCLSVIGAERVTQLGGPKLPDRPPLLLAALRGWLADQDEGARWIIGRTLGRKWTRPVLAEAVDLLRELALDERRPVRLAVISALRELRKMDERALDGALAAWRSDADARVRVVPTKVN